MKVLDIGAGKICVADSLNENFSAIKADAALIASPLTREVRLDCEITGITDFAVKAADASTGCTYPLLCGCTTVLGDMRHVSVMTFAQGKLVDIADRTLNLDSQSFCEGDTIKILRLKKIDVALLVDTDILLAKNWQRIASHCDAVLGIARYGSDTDFGYVPTLASLFGKPYAAAFASGEILWGTPPQND